MISESLIGAYTTQSEAAAACQHNSPDLLFVTEHLEQGYGLSLARHVKEFSPKTRILVFCIGNPKRLCVRRWKPLSKV